MEPRKLDRALGVLVLAIVAFNTLAATSLPVPAWKAGTEVIASWFLILVAHALGYLSGPGLRARFGLPAYTAIQATLLFALGATGLHPAPLLALFAALITELIVVAAPVWSPTAITVGGVVLFAASSTVAGGLYRGATAGVMLSVLALVGHVVVALFRRIIPAAAAVRDLEPAIRISGARPGADHGLTPREGEVLAELVGGRRTTEIAARLAISDRTVKAHLASIYQKMGVTSRAGAIALVLGSPER